MDFAAFRVDTVKSRTQRQLGGWNPCTNISIVDKMGQSKDLHGQGRTKRNNAHGKVANFVHGLEGTGFEFSARFPFFFSSGVAAAVAAVAIFVLAVPAHYPVHLA